MIAIKAAHLLILCHVMLAVSAGCPKYLHVCRPGCWYAPDSNNCSVCNCPKTCEYTKCDKGQKCVMKAVNCTYAMQKHCDPQPTCVPDDATTVKTTTIISSEAIYKPKTCPRPIECPKPCVADLGPDLCYSKCSCPARCKDKQCGADEVCKLVKVFCFRAPCFPIPTCFRKNETCSESPDVRRCHGGTSLHRWTYNASANVCQLFYYHGCIPSPNTFEYKRECTAACVDSCPRMCMENCYWAPNTPGTCSECVCPCQTMRCKANTECRLKEGDCSEDKPCHPTAYCAPVNTKPTTETTPCPSECERFCKYGHVEDNKGCDNCSCVSWTTASPHKAGHV